MPWPKKLEKGRFTTYCKQQGFEGPCRACAEKALKSTDPSVRGMASFYLNTTLKRVANVVSNFLNNESITR